MRRSRPPSSRPPVVVSVVVAALSTALVACSPTPISSPSPAAPSSSAPVPVPSPSELQLGGSGVASGHSLAAEAGAAMLDAGGNAADAAVAAAFADGVLQPFANGIGGGGAAVVAVDGELRNYDYREVVNQTGVIPESGAGVPGFVAGLARLHDDLGALEWSQVLQPAIRLAEEGAPVSGFLAERLATPLGMRVTAGVEGFRDAEGGVLQEGETLRQPLLASTMRAIAEGGAASFYTGPISDELVRVPGLDAASLAAYEVVVSAPATGAFGGFQIASAAPALPGAALIQMLQIAEAAGIGSVPPESAEFIDLQSRAWRVAEGEVQALLGDPAFTDVPVDRLTDPEANASLAASLAPAGVGAVAEYDGSPNTSHTSVIDHEGLAVSMTNTVTDYWGSGTQVGGFWINDQLSRFSAIGSGNANDPAPGRRSVSWSSPTIVLDAASRPVLVIGTPGGSHIPNTLASVITQWALHGRSLGEAVDAERFILTDAALELERGDAADGLRSLGWPIAVTPASSSPLYGSVQAIEADWATGAVSGHADGRRTGAFVLRE